MLLKPLQTLAIDVYVTMLCLLENALTKFPSGSKGPVSIKVFISFELPVAASAASPFE